MEKKKVLFIVLILVLVITSGVAVFYGIEFNKYKTAVEEITINEIDLSQIPDGIYTGSMETNWVGAEVTVTVENHAIIDIELEHRHGQGEAAEVIPSHVMEAQSLQVDTITEATYSSLIILKAIENALSN